MSAPDDVSGEGAASGQGKHLQFSMARPSLDSTGAASAPASPKTSSDRPRSKSYSGSGHKKTPSGSILSRIPFFRSSLEAPSPPPPTPSSPDRDDVIPFPDVPDPEEDIALPRSSAMASIMDVQGKGRKRKGSLRKTALLGTGRLRLDRRLSSSDTTKARSPTKSFFGGPRSPTKGIRASQAEAEAEAKEDTPPHATSSTSAEVSAERQTLQIQTNQSSNGLLSPLLSPTGLYGSTTDEDDRFSLLPTPLLPTLASLRVPSKPSLSPSPPSSESSVTNQPSITIRRPSNKVNSASPLSTPSPLDPNEDWDYSATEWWGWIILIVTWVVFVVGMGSCLEVWSWAWDVGETPYAPPELEDDPTLPIVGYYPALMVLTAVMSWVWVVVAWMGMKYFKHAKIQGEGT